jgi:glutathione S-transferase
MRDKAAMDFWCDYMLVRAKNEMSLVEDDCSIADLALDHFLDRFGTEEARAEWEEWKQRGGNNPEVGG